MKNIAVMFSGNGTDLQAVIDGQAAGAFDGKVVVAVSSNGSANGIKRAQGAGIDCYVCSRSAYSCERERYAHIARIFDGYAVDLVVLAGFLGIVDDALLQPYRGRMINIHPALLPKFGGKGMYGLHVHEAVIAAGEKKSGATVHFVESGVDTGKIILQRALDVLETDTAQSLQQRILYEVEHPLLVEAVRMICNGEVSYD